MGKDEDNLLKAIGVVVLGKLFFDALKKYRCPRCNFPVSKTDIVCPNCYQQLDWRLEE